MKKLLSIALIAFGMNANAQKGNTIKHKSATKFITQLDEKCQLYHNLKECRSKIEKLAFDYIGTEDDLKASYSRADTIFKTVKVNLDSTTTKNVYNVLRSVEGFIKLSKVATAQDLRARTQVWLVLVDDKLEGLNKKLCKN